MKQIIDGKTYNTETATHITKHCNSLGRGDFRHVSEGLYHTKKGAFFLAGEGGPMTKYSRPCGNGTCGGEGIIPLTDGETLAWLERHGETEAIETYLPHMIEEA